MKEDPPADAKCKDKFLVQSVAITGDLEFSNVTSIVSLIKIEVSKSRSNKYRGQFEKAPKSAIQERKIRVTYLPADSTTGPVC